MQARVVVGLAVRAGRAVARQALRQASAAAGADVLLQRDPRRRRERRQVIGAEVQFEVAALGQLDAVVQRLGQVGEQRAHGGGGFQVLLGAVLARALGIGQHAALLDAHARLVRLEILAFEKARVVAGQQRQVVARAQRQRGGDPVFLVRASATRQLQIQALGKTLTQALQQRAVGVIGQRALRQRAGMAGEGDQAVTGAVQPMLRDGRAPALLAFAPGARDQPRQIQIAGVVLAQQGQAPRFAVSIVAQPQIATDDRLDAVGQRRLVELDQREQVAVVGQRQRRQAEAARVADQVGPRRRGRIAVLGLVGNADDGVRQRVFAVDVQMDETRAHGDPQNAITAA